jgi:hypothetical protein
MGCVEQLVGVGRCAGCGCLWVRKEQRRVVSGGGGEGQHGVEGVCALLAIGSSPGSEIDGGGWPKLEHGVFAEGVDADQETRVNVSSSRETMRRTWDGVYAQKRMVVRGREADGSDMVVEVGVIVGRPLSTVFFFVFSTC